MRIDDLLNEREKSYGDFTVLANATQAFKSVYRASPAWQKMTAVQREVFDMVAVKKCRILYGDPMHADSWTDLAGYPILAAEEFARQDVTMAPAIEPKTANEIATNGHAKQ